MAKLWLAVSYPDVESCLLTFSPESEPAQQKGHGSRWTQPHLDNSLASMLCCFWNWLGHVSLPSHGQAHLVGSAVHSGSIPTGDVTWWWTSLTWPNKKSIRFTEGFRVAAVLNTRCKSLSLCLVSSLVEMIVLLPVGCRLPLVQLLCNYWADLLMSGVSQTLVLGIYKEEEMGVHVGGAVKEALRPDGPCSNPLLHFPSFSIMP